MLGHKGKNYLNLGIHTRSKLRLARDSFTNITQNRKRDREKHSSLFRSGNNADEHMQCQLKMKAFHYKGFRKVWHVFTFVTLDHLTFI
jgi:hypothetical protein